jgi:acetyl esterase/lipase
MVPTNDALRDESFQFALRLYKQGVDVRVKEYEFMPHGFLNYNATLLGMRDESNVTIN